MSLRACLIAFGLCAACASELPIELPTVPGSETADELPRWDLCAELAAHAGIQLPEGPTVSMARLLCDTVDLDRLTHAPSPAYRALMASSYSRASQVEGGDGWFANDDFGHYVRDQGDEHVMMEAHGPGAITRLWSPNPNGLIRIYVDDPDVPALVAPMLDLLSGHYRAPWGAPFVFAAAEGYSAYFPIPYTSYVRVSTTASVPLYYQVEHRAYAEGTQLQPFSAALLAALEPLARAIADHIAAPSALASLATLPLRELVLDDAAPERSVALGPAVIRELTVRGLPTSADRLRTTRLILTVDGERTVDAPLGDLFGAGPGQATYDSLAASMNASELTLRWPMPVRENLTVRVESSAGPIGALTFLLRHSRGVPAAYQLFHARWTGVQTFLSRAASDWTLLHQPGAGWYVGTLLNVGNESPMWWGEGDEKVFVDGEAFPSRFGTGTEDYFGYGFCSTERFARPWIGQTRADGPGNAGRSSLYRWHIAEAIPFTSELRFQLEVERWVLTEETPRLTEDAVAYWYTMPGAALPSEPLAISAFVVPPLAQQAAVVPSAPLQCRLPGNPTNKARGVSWFPARPAERGE